MEHLAQNRRQLELGIDHTLDDGTRRVADGNAILLCGHEVDVFTPSDA